MSFGLGLGAAGGGAVRGRHPSPSLRESYHLRSGDSESPMLGAPSPSRGGGRTGNENDPGMNAGASIVRSWRSLGGGGVFQLECRLSDVLNEPTG